MATDNENDEFKKLMDKYNFDSPIKVTLVVEEDNSPDPMSLKGLLLSKNANVANINVCSNNSEVYEKNTNVYNTRNQKPNAKKNCNRMLIAEENNHYGVVNQTFLSEAPQEKTEDIPWNLLDIVADNLIHITKCYYHNFINSKKQLGLDYEQLKSEYLTFKHHFFNLSYSITIAVILKHEYNKHFLNKFIHRVIKIANHNSWYKISFKTLETLIQDMLIWTKQKKKYLDIKFGSYNYERGDVELFPGAPTITNRLDPNINHLTQGTNSQNHIVRQTHLPVQVINTAPNIIRTINSSIEEMNSTLNYSSRTNNLMRNAINPSSSGHIENNSTHDRTNWPYPVTLHSQQEINISPNVTQRTNHSNQGIYNPFNIKRKNNSMQEITHMPYIDSRINYSTETITSIYNNEPKTNNINYCKAKNTDNKKILLSTGPPDQEITISVEPQILAKINQQYTNQLNINSTECHVNESYGTKPIKRRKTNDYYCNSNSMSYHNVNNSHYQKNNYSATTFKTQLDGLCQDDSRKTEYELFNPDTLRSSISRDSGFGSPAYGTSRNEEMIEPLINQEQEIPIISHVTSMNPNAVNLINGFCTVCNVITNNICIGCYQKYYCSTLCQNKDWDVHKYLCSS